MVVATQRHSSSGGGTREVSAVSESIGPVTVRTDYRDFGGTRSGTTTHGVADRSAFFIESAYRILLALNPDFIVPDHHNASYLWRQYPGESRGDR